jgi:hypothetical protein
LNSHSDENSLFIDNIKRHFFLVWGQPFMFYLRGLRWMARGINPDGLEASPGLGEGLLDRFSPSGDDSDDEDDEEDGEDDGPDDDDDTDNDGECSLCCSPLNDEELLGTAGDDGPLVYGRGGGSLLEDVR